MIRIPPLESDFPRMNRTRLAYTNHGTTEPVCPYGFSDPKNFEKTARNLLTNPIGCAIVSLWLAHANRFLPSRLAFANFGSVSNHM